uniref:Putative Arc repressor family protein n=1 Tax=viral metagenome TaxID=1070528 RepID=A0A6H1ZHL9_9ZZZZ
MTEQSQIHIRIPADLLQRIREQAEREHRKINGQIVHLLDKAISWYTGNGKN